MSVHKRDRSVNFTQKEVELLNELLAAHIHIIENKKSDATVWQEKEQSWVTIEAQFNSRSGEYFRSAKTLKAKYEGMKRIERKKARTLGNCQPEGSSPAGGPSFTPKFAGAAFKVKNIIFSTYFMLVVLC